MDRCPNYFKILYNLCLLHKRDKKTSVKKQEAVETNRRIAGHKPNWSQVTFIPFPKKNRSVRHYQRQYPCHS